MRDIYAIIKKLSGKFNKLERRVKDKEGKKISDEQRHRNRWMVNFEALLNRSAPHDPPDIQLTETCRLTAVCPVRIGSARPSSNPKTAREYHGRGDESRQQHHREEAGLTDQTDLRGGASPFRGEKRLPHYRIFQIQRDNDAVYYIILIQSQLKLTILTDLV